MKINVTKMMMLFTMFLSALTAMSTSSMLMIWTMMEINLMSFLPIMTKSKSMKDQPMKFFIIQSLASSMMLMSMLINSMTETPLSSSIMLMSSLLMKMGLLPFHMWVPMIMKPMTWENCFILMTMQKIIPTIFMAQMMSLKMLMTPMCLTMVMAPIMAIKQLSLKTIMAYSSISNSPWMIISLMNSKSQFVTFFSVYTIINFMMTKKFSSMNFMFLNQVKTQSSVSKISIIVNILSLSGMPPMMGFFPKWMILQSTMMFSIAMATSMIVSSIISTFIYMKMISPILTMNSMAEKKKKKNDTENDIVVNSTGTMLIMMMKSF
uniref:NADH-ubiquinone oxidoreductase chain 2 n=1 Tax=Pochazia shantungensis TaxID=2891616 RepID=A0A866UAR1_9HEMI|nr:NADH dehydrogenase subunit 2 [Pochazia shantungensis]QOE55902.1 NADH dehydrogenase subunit 2 [Pochazia shantungensis]